MLFNTQSQPLSLAAIQAGDIFEVLPSFAVSGAGCSRHRTLHAGARFFCRAAGDATVLLVDDERRTISVPRDAARFIPVRRMAS
jgi:hypothetical protein